MADAPGGTPLGEHFGWGGHQGCGVTTFFESNAAAKHDLMHTKSEEDRMALFQYFKLVVAVEQQTQTGAPSCLSCLSCLVAASRSIFPLLCHPTRSMAAAGLELGDHAAEQLRFRGVGTHYLQLADVPGAGNSRAWYAWNRAHNELCVCKLLCIEYRNLVGDIGSVEKQTPQRFKLQKEKHGSPLLNGLYNRL